MEECDRRRATQEAYNAEHGITPQTVVRALEQEMSVPWEADYVEQRLPNAGKAKKKRDQGDFFASEAEFERAVQKIEREMKKASEKLEFERAAELRDRLRYLKQNRVLSG